MSEDEVMKLLEKYKKLEEKVELQLIRLKEENRKLREALKARPSDTSYIADMRSLMDSERRRLEELVSKEKEAREKAEQRLAEVLKENERLKKTIAEAVDFLSSVLKPATASEKLGKEEIIGNLPPYERSIYDFLASHRGVPFTAYQISVATRKSVKSSAFRTALAKLVKLGLVKREGSSYRVP